MVDRTWELFDVPEPRAKAVKSVNQAPDALFSIAEADRPLSALALSGELDLPRPTVHRILDTLRGRGVVARFDDSSSFNTTISGDGPFGATPDKERSGLPGSHEEENR